MSKPKLGKICPNCQQQVVGLMPKTQHCWVCTYALPVEEDEDTLAVACKKMFEQVRGTEPLLQVGGKLTTKEPLPGYIKLRLGLVETTDLSFETQCTSCGQFQLSLDGRICSQCHALLAQNRSTLPPPGMPEICAELDRAPSDQFAVASLPRGFTSLLSALSYGLYGTCRYAAAHERRAYQRFFASGDNGGKQATLAEEPSQADQEQQQQQLANPAQQKKEKEKSKLKIDHLMRHVYCPTYPTTLFILIRDEVAHRYAYKKTDFQDIDSVVMVMSYSRERVVTSEAGDNTMLSMDLHNESSVVAGEQNKSSTMTTVNVFYTEEWWPITLESCLSSLASAQKPLSAKPPLPSALDAPIGEDTEKQPETSDDGGDAAGADGDDTSSASEYNEALEELNANYVLYRRQLPQNFEPASFYYPPAVHREEIMDDESDSDLNADKSDVEEEDADGKKKKKGSKGSGSKKGSSSRSGSAKDSKKKEKEEEEEEEEPPFKDVQYPTINQLEVGCIPMQKAGLHKRFARNRIHFILTLAFGITMMGLSSSLMVDIKLGFTFCCTHMNATRITTAQLASSSLLLAAPSSANGNSSSSAATAAGTLNNLYSNFSNGALAHDMTQTCSWTPNASSYVDAQCHASLCLPAGQIASQAGDSILYRHPTDIGNVIAYAVGTSTVGVFLTLLLNYFLMRAVAVKSQRQVFWRLLWVLKILFGAAGIYASIIQFRELQSITFDMTCDYFSESTQRLCSVLYNSCNVKIVAHLARTYEMQVLSWLMVLFACLVFLAALIYPAPTAGELDSIEGAVPDTAVFRQSAFAPDGITDAELLEIQKKARRQIKYSRKQRPMAPVPKIVTQLERGSRAVGTSARAYNTPRGQRYEDDKERSARFNVAESPVQPDVVHYSPTGQKKREKPVCTAIAIEIDKITDRMVEEKVIVTDPHAPSEEKLRNVGKYDSRHQREKTISYVTHRLRRDATY